MVEIDFGGFGGRGALKTNLIINIQLPFRRSVELKHSLIRVVALR